MKNKANSKIKKLTALFIALVLVFTLGSISVLAGNGDGTGGGDHQAELSLEAVRYSTGSGYADLEDASVSGTFTGYIRFDRGMTTYGTQSANFAEISLKRGSVSYALNLQKASANITDAGTTYDKKYIYTFSVSNLPSGTYTLTLGEGVTANNGQTLTDAPIDIQFSVS